MWVREFNGTVTHSIFFVNGSGGNGQDVKRDQNRDVDDTKFLYTKEGAYNSMEEAFVLFPLGSSTNGDIHALRGYGNDLLPHTRVIDKLMNQATDAAFLGMALNVSATNETSRLSAMVNPMGAYTIWTRQRKWFLIPYRICNKLLELPSHSCRTKSGNAWARLT